MFNHEAERPDDSGEYADETLLAIIAERFECERDPVTRRDGLWIVAQLDAANRRGELLRRELKDLRDSSAPPANGPILPSIGVNR